MVLVLEQRNEGRSAVSRIVTVLNALHTSGEPLSLSSLVRRTGLPKTTVHRLMQELTAHSLVERHGNRYSLGVAVGRLAGSVREERLRGARHRLLPHLVDLYEQTHRTVSLAILRGPLDALAVGTGPSSAVAGGPRVVFIERIFGHQHRCTPSDLTHVAPAHCTAIGKVLLAGVPLSAPVGEGHSSGSSPSGHPGHSGHSGRAWPTGLKRWTARTITDPAVLESELARIRREGIAYSSGEYVPGVCCVAVPVRDSQGHSIAAISVSGGPAARLDVAAVSADLRRTAHAISLSLRVPASGTPHVRTALRLWTLGLSPTDERCADEFL